MKARSCLAGAALIGFAMAAMLPGFASGSTLNVTTQTDEYGSGAACSLREAVRSAWQSVAFGGCPAGESNPAVDKIVLPAGQYALTIPDVAGDENANASGDLDVTGAIEISGAGITSTTISTGVTGRLIEAGSPHVTIRDLTMKGGDIRGEPGQDGWGAAFRSGAALNDLVRVRIAGGRAGVQGGAIYVSHASNLNISDSVLEDNRALSGGAIASNSSGKIDITDSVLYDNWALGDAGTDPKGGAIRVASSGTETRATGTEFIENMAVNTSGSPGDWASGGAIESESPIVIDRSLFTKNEAQALGGTVEDGGAIYALDDSTITNSTFHGNVAEGRGGAVLVRGGHSEIAFSTFVGNLAGGLGNHITTDPFAGVSTNISSSLLTAGFLVDTCGGTGSTSSGGYNVTDGNDPECGFGPNDTTAGTTGLVFTPEPLRELGGPTRTIAVAEPSDAIDVVPAAACGAAGGRDQRGAPWFRPYGAGCDAGAFELQPDPPPDPDPDPDPDPGPGDDVIRCAGKRATVRGTSGADRLKGTAKRDVIAGLGGRDTIRGLGGNDLICGGGGPDRMLGGRGKDRLLGGNGPDRLLGGPGRDRLAGGPGRDRLIGGPGSDRLAGGPGRDRVSR